MVPKVAETWVEDQNRGGWASSFVGGNLAPAAGRRGQLKVIWTPSHLNVARNDEADVLVEGGREQHPNNKSRLSEEPAVVEPAWEQLGLHPMRSDVLSSGG